MMELSHSLLLNEDALSQLQDEKKPVFVYEWLRFLNRVLPVAQKSDIKGCQQKLVQQLNNQIACCQNPASRKLLARCLAVLFSVGDTYSLFQTINFCNDLIKNKDDSPSFLPARLNAVCCLGAMYEKLGRMVGRSYEETAQLLIKSLKNSESQGRMEIMNTFRKMTLGLGTAAGSIIRKDIYKAARLLLTDRSLSVRCAAANCLTELTKQGQFSFNQELDNLVSSCLKALDGSNYEVRRTIATLLGTILAYGHYPKLFGKLGPSARINSPDSQTSAAAASVKPLTLDECWAVLASGFLKGAMGFYRNGSAPVSTIQAEIRVGMAMAYIQFLNILGPNWLERNSFVVLTHLLDLVASSSRSGSSNLPVFDCMHIRTCVCYIIRRTFGTILKEQAQIAVCKELGHLVAEQMNAVDLSMDSSMTRSLAYEHAASQQIVVVASLEMSRLVGLVGGSVTPLFVEASGVLEAIFSVLNHPCLPSRISSAWCLSRAAIVIPSLLTALIDRCIARIEHQKTSYDAISGYSLCIATLLTAIHKSQLGVPQDKHKKIFALAEDFIKTASQTSRLTLIKTQSGWLLISALMSLGPQAIRHHLPKIQLLWKNAFPRSAKEADNEKQRGDAFTWQVTLEARAGALASIQYFVSYCKELLTDDVLKRIYISLETTLITLGYLPQMMKQSGAVLKNPLLYVRYRLYKALINMNPKNFEALFSLLLRELVADFTLTDNVNVILSTVYEFSQFNHQGSAHLRYCFEDSDHRMVENKVLFDHHSCIGALENDIYELCDRDRDMEAPNSFPTHVALIDASIMLFGVMFPNVPNKHKIQMLDHFNECVKQAKGPKEQVVRTNIALALLTSLKAVADNKSTLDNENVIRSINAFFDEHLSSPNATLRFCSGDGMGRLTQLVADPRFLTRVVEHCFQKLKECRGEISRTGHSLALGCLHKYVGGLTTQQNLTNTVGILLALAQDPSSTVVQLWAIYSFSIVALSSGPMFRDYVEPVLTLCLRNLLTTNDSDVSYVTGKLVSAITLTIGPELQSNSSAVVSIRNSLLTICSILTENDHHAVKVEAVSCFQQLHLFAPRHVNLSTLVPFLCESLTSNYDVLRKASISCLRQLTQREAREVLDHASNLAPQGLIDKKVSILPENGLEGALFCLLDTEIDVDVVNNSKETLISLLQNTVNEQLGQWLTLCKEILVAVSSDVISPNQDQKLVKSNTSKNADPFGSGGGNLTDDAGEEGAMKIGGDEEIVGSAGPWYKAAGSSRYVSRCFAVEIVRKIIATCNNERAHFDLALARELQLSGGKSDYLVLHLSDLIRMSFMAATSNNVDLRLAGLACLQDVITNFAKVPEPEFPGHVILEQFQAQVGAALRPAFTPDTPSHVTAAACQVCSSWIGSGVARDLNDLRRVHQLLTFSLEKMNKGSITVQLYNESTATLEKLAILKAWAEVYIMASSSRETTLSDWSPNDVDNQSDDSLLQLVEPELAFLIDCWINALRDYAVLSLPSEFIDQASRVPHSQNYFTLESDSIDTIRNYYRDAWPQILLSTSIWLRNNDFEIDGKNEEKSKDDRFLLIIGSCMEALCNPKLADSAETINLCLRSLNSILTCNFGGMKLVGDYRLIVELLNVLHRVVLTRENFKTLMLCTQLLANILTAAESCLAQCAGEQSASKNMFNGGEGASNGKLEPGNSVVYAALEVCLCQLLKQIPGVNTCNSPTKKFANKHYTKLLTDGYQHLIATILKCLIRLPGFCSENGCLTILPVLFYLIINTLREMASIKRHLPTTVTSTTNNHSKLSFEEQRAVSHSPSVATALYCLRFLLSKPINEHSENENNGNSIDKRWTIIAQSALWSILALKREAGDNDSFVDETTLILALAIFLIAAPPSVVSVPNLLTSCVKIFQEALSVKVATGQYIITVLQSAQSIFRSKNKVVANTFIRALTPTILQKMRRFLDMVTIKENEEATNCDESNFEMIKNDLAVFIEAENALKIVIDCSVAGKSKTNDIPGFPLVSLNVQILATFLPFESADPHQICISKSSAKTQQQRKISEKLDWTLKIQLQELALEKLNKLGPEYPSEFKLILQRSPDIKSRLENALKKKEAAKMMNSNNNLSSRKNSVTMQQQPAITLTMNFSNFTATS